MKNVLVIAGCDCSGGAGLQADIKTITAHRQFGMGVTTAITAQNSTGLYGIFDVEDDFVRMQLDCVLSDYNLDAVKIGMVLSAENICGISEQLLEHEVKNIVIDPVMISTSGSKLLNDNAKNDLVKVLFPLADVLTPNITEAEMLTNMKIANKEDMLKSAEALSKQYPKSAIVIKGGHFHETADDLLFIEGSGIWFKGKTVNTSNLHGSGCIFSTSIACGIAEGFSIPQAVGNAKEYIKGALNNDLKLGNGNGPINAVWNI